jgi:hypothetical protein
MEQDLILKGLQPATRRNYLLYGRKLAAFYRRSPEELCCLNQSGASAGSSAGIRRGTGVKSTTQDSSNMRSDLNSE